MIVYCLSKDEQGNIQVTNIDGKKFVIKYNDSNYSEALFCYKNDLAFSIENEELVGVINNEK
ncbi:MULTISPECIES: hypothetical protein [Aerococcus]|uniref:hypothetical protein n=1 Tax=Aerococcus TaxID=1375 RepID=UPI0018A6E02E|nr:MULTISPECIES: hypothetical protein [Aerococcus]MCY3067602.1 hypothetical protein [Aerococcus mictus]MCY3080863.1 hypothetical protein [Aerococcus mictus]MDK8485468.1 hypothetical protein [Aerococcus urinae]